MITKDLKKLEQGEDTIEGEFTVARRYVFKMKSEAKNLVSRVTSLEQQHQAAGGRTETLEKKVSKCRQIIVQHEAKMKPLNETIRESDVKNRNLGSWMGYGSR